MRISDWSSDVCSSDLSISLRQTVPCVRQTDARRRSGTWRGVVQPRTGIRHLQHQPVTDDPRFNRDLRPFLLRRDRVFDRILHDRLQEIGRASRRDSVCEYVYTSAVAVSLKKKTTYKRNK